ncbi:MAG: phosphoglucosamine mutase [Acidimicrobiaceae bacterium]|nr:phosphoglucosamine mutase [Acidimicrobiaceae bacterium]
MPTPVCFGTDGIRGRALVEITPDLAYRLGHAVAHVFKTPVFVGYDTRESSPVLAAAVLAGLSDGGAQGVNLGYFTTPGVAVIARQRGGVGVVVSASHNPFQDNGLKVLGPGGGKLDHATENAVTKALNAAPRAAREYFEEVAIDHRAQHDYAAHLRGLVPVDLSSLHIVLDCANGAASHVAHELFESTGARITVIHDAPDGRNINEHCGSTHVESLVAKVIELRADLGLAFDGDADRLVAVDANGRVRDGDDLMVLFATDLNERQVLGGGLVVTTMSNLGLRRAMNLAGIELVETDVGDRNVLLALEQRRWCFGGEQSGHLIFRDLSPTGDGLLTGMLLAELVVRRGPLGPIADAQWSRLPQELVNVARDAFDAEAVHDLFDELCTVYATNPGDVRLLVRPSGTEPVIRVMIEALEAKFVDEFCSRLANLFFV